ncbi:MAG: hypothetical protein J5778_05450 [Clostridiales bacterium]|nr:hypothetical protein [Clostridiales bacterium]
MVHMNSDEIFITIIGLAILGFVITSTVLFIVDWVKARREKRRRKIVFIVLFLAAIDLALVIAGFIGLLYFIGYAIMTSM